MDGRNRVSADHERPRLSFYELTNSTAYGARYGKRRDFNTRHIQGGGFLRHERFSFRKSSIQSSDSCQRPLQGVGRGITKSLFQPKVCEHEPVKALENFVSSTTISPGRVGWSYFENDLSDKWYCAKCGAKLKAVWSEV